MKRYYVATRAGESLLGNAMDENEDFRFYWGSGAQLKSELEQRGWEFTRLVPAVEIEKAWEEGIYAFTDDNDTEINRQVAWRNSRSKRVSEGKE